MRRQEVQLNNNDLTQLYDLEQIAKQAETVELLAQATHRQEGKKASDTYRAVATSVAGILGEGLKNYNIDTPYFDDIINKYYLEEDEQDLYTEVVSVIGSFATTGLVAGLHLSPYARIASVGLVARGALLGQKIKNLAKVSKIKKDPKFQLEALKQSKAVQRTSKVPLYASAGQFLSASGQIENRLDDPDDYNPLLHNSAGFILGLFEMASLSTVFRGLSKTVQNSFSKVAKTGRLKNVEYSSLIQIAKGIGAEVTQESLSEVAIMLLANEVNDPAIVNSLGLTPDQVEELYDQVLPISIGIGLLTGSSEGLKTVSSRRLKRRLQTEARSARNAKAREKTAKARVQKDNLEARKQRAKDKRVEKSAIKKAEKEAEIEAALNAKNTYTVEGEVGTDAGTNQLHLPLTNADGEFVYDRSLEIENYSLDHLTALSQSDALALFIDNNKELSELQSKLLEGKLGGTAEVIEKKAGELFQVALNSNPAEYAKAREKVLALDKPYSTTIVEQIDAYLLDSQKEPILVVPTTSKNAISRVAGATQEVFKEPEVSPAEVDTNFNSSAQVSTSDISSSTTQEQGKNTALGATKQGQKGIKKEVGKGGKRTQIKIAKKRHPIQQEIDDAKKLLKDIPNIELTRTNLNKKKKQLKTKKNKKDADSLELAQINAELANLNRLENITKGEEKLVEDIKAFLKKHEIFPRNYKIHIADDVETFSVKGSTIRVPNLTKSGYVPLIKGVINSYRVKPERVEKLLQTNEVLVSKERDGTFLIYQSKIKKVRVLDSTGLHDSKRASKDYASAVEVVEQGLENDLFDNGKDFKGLIKSANKIKSLIEQKYQSTESKLNRQELDKLAEKVDDYITTKNSAEIKPFLKETFKLLTKDKTNKLYQSIRSLLTVYNAMGLPLGIKPLDTKYNSPNLNILNFKRLAIQDERFKPIAKLIEKSAPLLDNIRVEKTDKGVLGRYNPRTDEILISSEITDSRQFSVTLAHELLHRKTWHLINKNPQFRDEIAALYEQAEKAVYATKNSKLINEFFNNTSIVGKPNLHEFVSFAMTDLSTRELLNAPIKKSFIIQIYEKILEILSKFFKVKELKSPTVLEQLETVIFKTPNREGETYTPNFEYSNRYLYSTGNPEVTLNALLDNLDEVTILKDKVVQVSIAERLSNMFSLSNIFEKKKEYLNKLTRVGQNFINIGNVSEFLDFSKDPASQAITPQAKVVRYHLEIADGLSAEYENQVQSFLQELSAVQKTSDYEFLTQELLYRPPNIPLKKELFNNKTTSRLLAMLKDTNALFKADALTSIFSKVVQTHTKALTLKQTQVLEHFLDDFKKEILKDPFLTKTFEIDRLFASKVNELIQVDVFNEETQILKAHLSNNLNTFSNMWLALNQPYYTSIIRDGTYVVKITDLRDNSTFRMDSSDSRSEIEHLATEIKSLVKDNKLTKTYQVSTELNRDKVDNETSIIHSLPLEFLRNLEEVFIKLQPDINSYKELYGEDKYLSMFQEANLNYNNDTQILFDKVRSLKKEQIFGDKMFKHFKHKKGISGARSGLMQAYQKHFKNAKSFLYKHRTAPGLELQLESIKSTIATFPDKIEATQYANTIEKLIAMQSEPQKAVFVKALTYYVLFAFNLGTALAQGFGTVNIIATDYGALAQHNSRTQAAKEAIKSLNQSFSEVKLLNKKITELTSRFDGTERLEQLVTKLSKHTDKKTAEKIMVLQAMNDRGALNLTLNNEYTRDLQNSVSLNEKQLGNKAKIAMNRWFTLGGKAVQTTEQYMRLVGINSLINTGQKLGHSGDQLVEFVASRSHSSIFHFSKGFKALTNKGYWDLFWVANQYMMKSSVTALGLFSNNKELKDRAVALNSLFFLLGGASGLPLYSALGGGILTTLYNTLEDDDEVSEGNPWQRIKAHFDGTIYEGLTTFGEKGLSANYGYFNGHPITYPLLAIGMMSTAFDYTNLLNNFNAFSKIDARNLLRTDSFYRSDNPNVQSALDLKTILGPVASITANLGSRLLEFGSNPTKLQNSLDVFKSALPFSFIKLIQAKEIILGGKGFKERKELTNEVIYDYAAAQDIPLHTVLQLLVKTTGFNLSDRAKIYESSNIFFDRAYEINKKKRQLSLQYIQARFNNQPTGHFKELINIWNNSARSKYPNGNFEIKDDALEKKYERYSQEGDALLKLVTQFDAT